MKHQNVQPVEIIINLKNGLDLAMHITKLLSQLRLTSLVLIGPFILISIFLFNPTNLECKVNQFQWVRLSPINGQRHDCLLYEIMVQLLLQQYLGMGSALFATYLTTRIQTFNIKPPFSHLC